jgi:CBS domain-containing protein
MINGKERSVREIMMSMPVTLKPEDTLDMANDIITLGRIRHIPIVEEGRLVGLLSQRDLLGTAATSILGLKPKTKKALLKSFQIREVMRKAVITTGPGTAITDAAKVMADKKIGCLPIVEGDSLIGLVTVTDLLRYVETL